MERNPDKFFFDGVVPGSRSKVRSSADIVAQFIGASGNNICFVENVTSGIESVLRSISFRPGEKIIITNHNYGAVRLAVERRCSETGAVPLVLDIPVPADDEEIVRIVDKAADGAKIAVLDHITSQTALLFPVERLVSILREKKVLTIIDGAHTIGQLEIELSRLKADWYVTNAHKWLYAPKGSGLLYCSDDRLAETRPAITSHFYDFGFPESFDYVGTRDVSAWLSIPCAIGFHQAMGVERLRKHLASLIDDTTDRLLGIGALTLGPRAMAVAMRGFVLPQRRFATEADSEWLQKTLWDKHRIQTRVIVWQNRLILRVSAQAYVDHKDIEHLAYALDHEGWPARE